MSDFFLILASLSLFAIAIVLVPTMLVLIRALLKLDALLASLNRHIDPFCSSLNEAASELRILTLSLNDRLEKSEGVINTARKAADTLLLASSMLAEAVRPAIISIAGISAGIRGFSRFLTKKVF